jgi:hypothetical protein
VVSPISTGITPAGVIWPFAVWVTVIHSQALASSTAKVKKSNEITDTIIMAWSFFIFYSLLSCWFVI